MSCIYLLFNELNQIVQQPVAQIQDTDNLSNKIAQQPVVQLGEIPQTQSAIYHSDVCQIEEIFKQSAIAATNWANHVILLNSKFRLGECYSTHQLINSKS